MGPECFCYRGPGGDEGLGLAVQSQLIRNVHQVKVPFKASKDWEFWSLLVADQQERSLLSRTDDSRPTFPSLDEVPTLKVAIGLRVVVVREASLRGCDSEPD